MAAVWTCASCNGKITPFSAVQAKCPHCGALINRPTPVARPVNLPRRRAILLGVAAIVGLLILVGTIVGRHNTAKTNNQVASWCSEHGLTGAGVGTVPVELSALQELGSPTSTVTHDGAIYLGYGSKTLIFNDDGGTGENTYVSGC